MDPKPHHPWQARLIVAGIMLLLAFLGMIVTQIDKNGGWDYWKWVVAIYALLAIWLSWYMKKMIQSEIPFVLLHELLHWGGVIGAVLLVSAYVHLGVMSRYIAGIADLTLVALGIFLAGIYLEKTFLFIGLVLALMAFFSAFITQYLYAIIIPLMVVAAIGI